MSRRLRRGVAAVAFVCLAAVALVVIRGSEDVRGVPLHPDSTGPAGTKALIELLRALDIEVSVEGSVDSPAPGAVLLLLDRLSPSEREQLSGWVRDGGRLVVTDPSSPLSAPAAAVGSLRGVAPACDLPALGDVGAVEAPRTVLLMHDDGAAGCFPHEDGFWFVERQSGDGVITSLGGAEPFMNRRIDAADNAVLAAALVAGEGQAAAVTVVYPLEAPVLGGGEGSLSLLDLIPRRVRLALLQLTLAFALVAAWRARRLGRPVSEPQPVAIPGAQLTAASGALLQHARARGAAAELLREDLRRQLARRLGLPTTSSTDTLAAALAARGNVPPGVEEALAGRPPRTDDDLLRLARDIDRVRDTILEQGAAL